MRLVSGRNSVPEAGRKRAAAAAVAHAVPSLPTLLTRIYRVKIASRKKLMRNVIRVFTWEENGEKWREVERRGERGRNKWYRLRRVPG